MKLIQCITLILFSFSLTMYSQNEIPSKTWQLETAVLGLEEQYREKAKVYGYDADGNFIVLEKAQTNMFVLPTSRRMIIFK